MAADKVKKKQQPPIANRFRHKAKEMPSEMFQVNQLIGQIDAKKKKQTKANNDDKSLSAAEKKRKARSRQRL